jgi:hypothetical protein
LTASHQGHTYRDAAGWAIEVPPGWHAVRFSDSRHGITAAGVQLSNVRLPPPALAPGFPIQANGGLLPAHGIGLIIATDTDAKLPHGPVAVPPLPAPWAHSSPVIGSGIRGQNSQFCAVAILRLSRWELFDAASCPGAGPGRPSSRTVRR